MKKLIIALSLGWVFAACEQKNTNVVPQPNDGTINQHSSLRLDIPKDILDQQVPMTANVWPLPTATQGVIVLWTNRIGTQLQVNVSNSDRVIKSIKVYKRDWNIPNKETYIKTFTGEYNGPAGQTPSKPHLNTSNSMAFRALPGKHLFTYYYFNGKGEQIFFEDKWDFNVAPMSYHYIGW